MRIALFTYDFAHAKSVAVYRAIQATRHEVGIVLAAPRVEIGLPAPRINPRIKVNNPVDRLDREGTEYLVAPHDEQVAHHIDGAYDLGVVGGARILPPDMIDAFPLGILNLHPGLLPDNRGLQTIHYAVYRQLTMGVTAHLIDERVDAGRLVCRREVPVYYGDTWDDVRTRLFWAELEILPRALALLAMNHEATAWRESELGPANTPGDPSVDDFLERHWQDYVIAFGQEAPA